MDSSSDFSIFPEKAATVFTARKTIAFEYIFALTQINLLDCM